MLWTEALVLGFALGRSGAVPALVAAGAAWWLLIAVVFAAGAFMLVAPDGRFVDRYGLPNGLTALRAWACLPLILVALLPFPGRSGLAVWGGVGGGVGLLDAVDGFLARRIGPVTALGKAMDPLMDTLFFVTGAAGSWLLGIIPLWLAALVMFRYAAPVLLTPFVFLVGRRPELVHTRWGRRNTILTGAVLFVLYWVRLARGPVWLAALIVALPSLVPTMLLHFAALLRRVEESAAVRPAGPAGAGAPPASD